ncbi:exodeoxyribonuclease VII large subunit [Intestinimonas butyriciproducens]|uniref:exodeoxyribonuclease VII large subunit n=1 Tax=Intestinimonas butyriciproducens TaxID=1297617 RepID=UPI0024331B71|nr:exodeoxyribonuclease VII large subunit [Intestinimonas butyriciproducens]MCI6362004.1 exodeoxyribonuclease VII large subunit [Intestinimonas butyriciproducens]MDY3615232.1 exodeoxyribonuclease VII large subunit [Intestinimonas butyriciproducens]
MREGQPVYTVTQVNGYIKNLLDRDGLLSGVFVRGEISNYKSYPSGHHYFSMKDEGGALRCVMFRREASRLRFRPENGMKLIAFGRVAVFPRDGQYQLYCSDLTPDGVGDLHVAFEQLKEKLFREGLFDPAHKKNIPRYPGRIALVTSSAGAAVRDMLRILGARYPLAKVLLLPVRVQGEEAAGEIASAIRYASAHALADLLITGRGGGSMEDLWCFNDERVARAIYDCTIPVISAVGHEPDVTIADFVADLRAATPSNAAELAVPDQNEIYANLAYYEDKLMGTMEVRLDRARRELARLEKNRVLQDPINYILDRRALLEDLRRRLVHGLGGVMAGERERFARLAAALDAMSPLKVLGRGYALAQTANGKVATSVDEVEPGGKLSVRLSDGVLDCRVDDKRRLL